MNQNLVLTDNGDIVADKRLAEYIQAEGGEVVELRAGDILTPDHPLYEALKRAGLVAPIYAEESEL